MKYFSKIIVGLALVTFTLKANSISVIYPEYLDWNTLRINNKLPLLCKKADLVALLGNVDSLVTPQYQDICASYFDTSFKYLYFKNCQFETRRELAVVSIIDFELSNIKLVSPIITLDKFVTLEKIKQLFPLAVKNAETLYVDNKGYLLCVKIATTKKETDDGWLLFFRNGKLLRIDHWIPC